MIASLVMATALTDEFYRNRVFEDNPYNNDGLFECLIQLREKLAEKEVILHTEDLVDNPDFEIYLEGMGFSDHECKKFLIALESPLINPFNGDNKYKGMFDKVFTWQDRSVMFPSNIKFTEFNRRRGIFSSMIAGNKSHGGPLYAERIKVIEWYGESDLFQLYGKGWNHEGWRGEIPYKSEILENSRFSWCFENSEQKNYITEKIFDCFTAGSVPVYWGAPNITDFVPSNCFVDRRCFQDTEEVHDYLMGMNQEVYWNYQENIANFLKSDKAYLFSNENFSTIIANAIASNLRK